MRAKKIVLFRIYSGYGGIERQLLHLGRTMLRDGWDVTLVTDVASPMSAAAKEGGIRVRILEGGSFPARVLEVRRICKEQGASILQAHTLHESIISRFVKALTPGLTHIFRVHTYIDCAHISRMKKNLYHLMSWLTDPWVKRYVSINRYNVAEMRGRSHLPARKISVIHNVLNEDVAAFDVTERYETSADPRCIAMVSNFVDFKGHDVLLDGLRILRERGVRVKVRMIGGVHGQGTDHEDNRRLDIVRSTIEEYDLADMAQICGVSTDIPASLRECGMVVLPSDSEGTPNVLLEAMWLRRLAVASAVGGVPEFIEDGKTGFLHPPRDARAFADAVERALALSERERADMLSAARGVIEREYLMPGVYAEFCKIYDAVL